MTKELTLRQLRYFAAAAETGQVSMAASQVCVSQSAITNAVRMLEETLGVQLFERHPQGVVLTAEGKSFYRHARHILDSVQDALRSPTLPAASIEGVIRIGATYTLLGYRRLLKEAGFFPQKTYRAVPNYRYPESLVPLSESGLVQKILTHSFLFDCVTHPPNPPLPLRGGD